MYMTFSVNYENSHGVSCWKILLILMECESSRLNSSKTNVRKHSKSLWAVTDELFEST